MTAAELIAKLREFPPDTPVMVPGFDESGIDHLATVETEEVVLVAEPGVFRHSGRYETVADARPVTTFGAPFSAVILNF